MNQFKAEIALNGSPFYKISNTEVIHLNPQD